MLISWSASLGVYVWNGEKALLNQHIFKVVFDKVVLLSDKTTKVGAPYVKGAKVTATVEKHGKGKKIVIFKYKPKKGSSHRRQGHRQPFTKCTIKSIEA